MYFNKKKLFLFSKDANIVIIKLIENSSKCFTVLQKISISNKFSFDFLMKKNWKK